MSAVGRDAPTTSGRLASGLLDAALMTSAPLAIGLALDRWLGFLPGLAATCGGTGSLSSLLIWHWTCTPATLVATALGGPLWIVAQMAANAGYSQSSLSRRLVDAGAAMLGAQFAMVGGMIGAMSLGPRLAALAGFSWTTGASVAFMALGMTLGAIAAAALARHAQRARDAADCPRALELARPPRSARL